MSEEHGKLVNSLTSERQAKHDFTVLDARSKGQMEFCFEKLSDALGKLESLESLRDGEVQRISESGGDRDSTSALLDSLSQDIEGQRKIISCCESWASDGRSNYLKVRETESGVVSRVTDLEERIAKLDRHEVAVKSCLVRLESGLTLFRSVPPQPIPNLSSPSLKEWIQFDACVYCGFGFEPVWAVVLATCKCAYHNICCRVHFQDYTTCIEVKCKKEMHPDWWAANGIVKPGMKVFHDVATVTTTRPATIRGEFRLLAVLL